MSHKNVTLRIDSDLWKKIKMMALKEETTIYSIINELLAESLKWIHKAEIEEGQIKNFEKATEELNEAQNKLDAIREERKTFGEKRGKHKGVNNGGETNQGI